MTLCRSWLLHILALGIFPSLAYGIPSSVDHVHDLQTVSWKHDDAPAVPWDNDTADMWNHNHLTADPFDKFQTWKINKSWDNRAMHSSVPNLGPEQFGHGLIETSMPVRYRGDASVPADAMPVIEAGFGSWISATMTQFNAKKDAWDRLAIHFEHVEEGPSEIGVRFVNALDGAYAQFTTGNELQFVDDPEVVVETDALNKRIRKMGETTNSTSISYQTPWNYTGSPDRLPDIAIEFSDDSGATWGATAPAGFGDLTLIAGDASTTTPSGSANPLFVFEMDFKTIALHEIGHAIALGHAGTGIMRANIAQYASFGSTQQTIESDEALAAAIAYTYSVPEPSTTFLAALCLGLLLLRRSS